MTLNKFIIFYVFVGGRKRSSPLTEHPRPTKMMYSDDTILNSSLHQTTLQPLLSPEINSLSSDEKANIRTRIDDGMLQKDKYFMIENMRMI